MRIVQTSLIVTVRITHGIRYSLYMRNGEAVFRLSRAHTHDALNFYVLKNS